MSVIYIMIPAAIVLAGAALWAFVWSVKRGQLDDLDTAPLRAVFDDDDDVVGATPSHEKRG